MMSTLRPRVVACFKFPDVAMNQLRENFDLRSYEGAEPMSRDELRHFLAENGPAEAIVCTLNDKFDRDTLLAIDRSKLKIISTMSVGFDHIDLKACTELGILVGNTPGVLTDATADLTVTLLLSSARRIAETANTVRSGEWGAWKPEWMLGHDISGSTVGIVGLGRIGFAVGERLKPFHCNLIYHDQAEHTELGPKLGAKYIPNLDDLFAQSDFVTLHCPLTEHTKHLMNKETFAKMKSNAILVNTSRGPVVDMDDLYDALKDGVIAGAALDVTVPEPLPTNSKLLTLKNLLIVPHIGSATRKTRDAMASMAVENVSRTLLDSSLWNANAPFSILNSVVSKN